MATKGLNSCEDAACRCDYLLMDGDDLEKRVAELERQLAEAKAAARAADAAAPPGAVQDAIDVHAQRLAAALQADRDRQYAQALGFRKGMQTGGPSGPEMAQLREAFKRAVLDAGLTQEQYREVLERAGLQAGGMIKVGGQVVYQSCSPTDPVFLMPRGRRAALRGGAGDWRQAALPAASADSQLAPAPRRVPAAFLFAEMLPFRWWYVFALGLVGTGIGFGLIIVWMHVPMGFSVAAVLTLAAIYAVNSAAARKRFELLKWGQVATVTGTRTLSRGTYYSGTTYSNAKLPVARGWHVERPFYSGPSTKTLISYTINGAPGELVLSGREYYGGVVLADPRNPARALCVTSFPYDLDRDASGNWIGSLRTGLQIGMAAWLIIVVSWLGLAVSVALLGLTG